MATTVGLLSFVHNLRENRMSEVWKTLSLVDVSDHTEEKNGLTYLSWAWAWGIVKDHYPSAKYTKHLHDGAGGSRPYMLDENGYAFVTVSVDIEGHSQTEVLPVLNYANKAVANPDSFQVNTALQRCLAKCCAMHGLGHYIYAGEDLPNGAEAKHITTSADEDLANGAEAKHTITSADGKKEEVEGVKLVAEVFNTFIPDCQTVPALRKFWSENQSARSALEKGDKKLYEEVLSNFKRHADTLETKGEAA